MKKIIIRIMCISLLVAVVFGAMYLVRLSNQEHIHTDLMTIPRNTDGLIYESDLIVRAKLNRAEKSKTTKHEGVSTDFIFDIDEVYKGKPYNDKQITVRSEQGKVGNQIVTSSRAPDFESGENVILMLVEVKRDNPSEVYYMVEGGRQGVFRKAQGEEEYVNFLNDSIMLSTFGYLIKDSVNFYENYDEIMEAQTRQRIRQNHGYINVTETDERVLDEDLREWYQVAIDGSTEINENELKRELESRQRRRQKNFDYDSLELDESLLEITGYPRVTLDELRAIEDEAVEKLFREKTKEEIDELNPWDVQ